MATESRHHTMDERCRELGPNEPDERTAESSAADPSTALRSRQEHSSSDPLGASPEKMAES